MEKVTLRSKDQLAVIAFLETNKIASVLKLGRQMGWSNKHTHAITGRLIRIGVLKNVGKPGKPLYRLVQRWQTKVRLPEQNQPAPQPLLITDVCRQNWQGYQIHKIFGGART